MIPFALWYGITLGRSLAKSIRSGVSTSIPRPRSAAAISAITRRFGTRIPTRSERASRVLSACSRKASSSLGSSPTNTTGCSRSLCSVRTWRR